MGYKLLYSERDYIHKIQLHISTNIYFFISIFYFKFT